MPIFADKIFHSGAHGLGILLGINGAGALCGALVMAARRGIKGLSVWVALAAAVVMLAFLLMADRSQIFESHPSLKEIIEAILLVTIGGGLLVAGLFHFHAYKLAFEAHARQYAELALIFKEADEELGSVLKAPAGDRYFRAVFTVPASRNVKHAVAIVGAEQRCDVWFNGEKIAASSNASMPQDHDVTRLVRAGENVHAHARAPARSPSRYGSTIPI